jgi:hypothetical protein
LLFENFNVKSPWKGVAVQHAMVAHRLHRTQEVPTYGFSSERVERVERVEPTLKLKKMNYAYVGFVRSLIFI